MTNATDHLLNNVLHWCDLLEGRQEAQIIEDGYESFWHMMSESILDIEHRDRGSEVTVALGGPTVWIDTRREVVVGVWGNKRIERGYTDNVGLQEHLEDLHAVGG
jgi:hypothetical protein